MTVDPHKDTFEFAFDPAVRHARRAMNDAETEPEEVFYEAPDGAFRLPPVPDEEFWGSDVDDDAPPLKRPPSVWRDLLGLLAKIAGVLVVFGLILSFTHGIARNTDPDMAPTVKAGDVVMFYRLDKNYQVSDLIALRYQGQLEVRRVVAQAGDVVDITADGLTVNGALQQEPDIYEPTLRYQTGTQLPVTLGPGQVFVLGDARDNATDSRVYGPVDTKDTLGKVIAIIKWRDL